MKRYCLYIHTNLVNGKKYVGITSQKVEKRWENGHGYNENLRFGRAIKKYGWDAFEHRVLLKDLCKSEAECMERYFISILNTQDSRYGYNMTSGGDGVRDVTISKESRTLMSIAKRGCNHPNYGKELPESTRAKISAALAGNKNSCGAKRSAETREKMSRSKFKPVIMIDGNTFTTFLSAKEAEQKTGISRKNISMCCKGIRKHAGGYAWKFA